MTIAIWTGFILLILLLLAIDLGVVNKKDHVISFKESLRWTALWVTVSAVFAGAVYYLYANDIAGLASSSPRSAGSPPPSGLDAALLYVTGYLVEYSLSVDNIFVIAILIGAFRVPAEYQHRVLFWGIIGALLMRGLMIGAGALLLAKVSWMMYVFGGILILTAIKMALSKEDESVNVQDSWTLRVARRFYPVSEHFDGPKFFTSLPDGRRAVTPLMLVLLLVETTDVIFAVDSIPAVFSITLDPFLVFTSNVFAILGLRSLYFALAGMLGKFHHLKKSLVVLMAFIGVKMLGSHYFHLPPWLSLLVIAAILGVGVAASLMSKPDDGHKPA